VLSARRAGDGQEIVLNRESGDLHTVQQLKLPVDPAEMALDCGF